MSYWFVVGSGVVGTHPIYGYDLANDRDHRPRVINQMDSLPISDIYNAWVDPFTINLWKGSTVYKKFSKQIRNT